jgi:hypothetical protein
VLIHVEHMVDELKQEQYMKLVVVVVVEDENFDGE